MHVDLAELTLSKEVENALATIKELKNISKGTRDYIKYSRKYREIMHSKINFQFLEDPHINTLKQIFLSINGFIGMLTYILNKYPSAMIQAKRISQDMLEGLFVLSEIKSVNYGKTDGTGTEIIEKINKKLNNKENNYIYQKHLVRLAQISSLSYNVFKNLLTDDLIMGKIKFPLGPYHKNVDQENIRIFRLQSERHQLIKTIFYQNSIDKLLQKWQDIIKNIASADNNLKPEKIIVLKLSEALKFSYIIGWIVYKLTKNDNITKLCPEFEAIKTHLMTLNSEQHTEFGSNILQYIHNSLLCNLLLLENFNTLINISTQMLSTCDSINITKYELKDNAREFLYERIIIIYMKSRQKSWQKFNDLIPEKGTSSFRENLKAMCNDTENNIPTLIKKFNLLKDPMFVSELQWLLWAFGDNMNNKRKKSLIPLILEHLKKSTVNSLYSHTFGTVHIW
ncbi:hypothetical protein RhiirC2_791452 [Rhizophagus irregularis]|uniref:Uncharacterized protein n=1 Tax=Rhizophagus irregularis TaxID=588596 RepID=A0A2N1MJ72_9GLOM|nr:hypothetical protein RhiirC2_791452 [Rhizophagus irregularis]